MSIYNINTASIDNLVATGSLMGTSSYATTASYALNGGGSGTSLGTGSTYPFTSSWSVSSSWAPSTPSSTAISASWASSSISSSYSLSSSYGLTSWSSSYALTTSYSLSSSYSATTLSSSYASTASYLNPGANIYLSQSYIIANTSSVQPTFQPGMIWWDNNAKTYAMYSDHSGVSLQIGQEEWIRSYAGENIPNGSPVYVTNSLNDLPVVKLALADGLSNNYKHNVVGLATEYIPSGSIGVITSQGQIHDLDTSMYTEGQILYLSNANSGSLVGTPPLVPYEMVTVGYVITSNSGSGIIQVNVTNPGIRQFIDVGMTSVPTIRGTGGGSFTVGTASVNLCSTSDGRGPIYNFQLPSASFTITSSFIDVQYLIATYDSGSPHYSVVTDLSTVDDIQSTSVATFTIGTSGTLSYIDWDTSGILLSNKLNKRIIDLYGAQHASGLDLSYSASHITITAGTGYIGIKKLTFTTSSTANTNQFALLSHSASVWSGSFINGWINTIYDDGTNLQTLGNNKYVVNYVYRGIGSLNRSQVILSTQYNQYADAVAGTVPTPPTELKDISILTGRIITQQGNATPLLVESAFTTILSVAGVTTHNDLIGLQGGIATQYYHLTAAEYADGSGSSGPFLRQTGSFLLGTASLALTASYLPTRVYNITSSWANTASYVASASYYPSFPTNIASASWASSSISSSYSLSSSYVDPETFNNLILAFEFTYNNSTSSSDPGKGNFRYNSLTSGSITEIYVNKLTSGGLDVSTIINSLKSGSYNLYIQQKTDSTKASLFTVANNSIDNTGWFTIPVNYITSADGGLPKNNQSCAFLIINKNSIVNGQTYLITSSWANNSISSSFATNSISSSYALTSSIVTGFNFSNTQSVVSTINTQTVISQVITGSYIAAFFDYAAVSASNIRAGIVFGSWVNGNINYTEVSNVDIGDTSAVTMSMGLNGPIVQLSSSANTNLWTIKAMGRYL